MQPAVYMMASQRNGTLYTGVASHLARRVFEHKASLVAGFTKKYRCHLLVFYELHCTMEAAINREKALKAGSRKKKMALIEKSNPTWADLSHDLI